MSYKKFWILTPILLMLILLFSGCSIQFSSDGKADKGGVFMSGNKGKNWKQSVEVPVTGNKSANIGNIVVNELAPDPGDPDAVYLASRESGLFYTYNISEGWRKAKGLPDTGIDAVAVDPDSKCIIYASTRNKLYKSTDCNRTWESVYHDNKKQARITALAIDHYDSDRIFIGTSRGIILSSEDGGETWKKKKDVENEITGLHVSPHDSRIMFATTKNRGTYRTKDGGDEWSSLEENMEEFNNSVKVRDLDISASEEGWIFMATDYGMLKSEDNGDNWSQIELLTPEKEATINSVAVNPKDPEEIYYVTEYTFYRSLNGGDSWSSKELPTSRSGSSLLINSKETNIIYLGIGSKTD